MESVLPTIQLTGVVVGFPLLAWLFGWSVLGRFTRLDREERFAASWGVSFAFLALMQFVAFATQTPPFVSQVVTLLVLVGVSLLCRVSTDERTDDGPTVAPLLLGFGLVYLNLVLVTALLPCFRGSMWYFDWWMHYDAALVFLGDRPTDESWANGYTLASRTPQFNLLTAAIMAAGGHDFPTYQLASCLPSVAFVLPVYLLLRHLFDCRAARLALLLAPLNLWLLHNAWFCWPKMLAAYFILLALYFYLRSLRLRPVEPERATGYFLAFGVCGVLGYLTHQVALVYLLPLLLHLAVVAVRNRNYRPHLGELAALAGVALVAGGVWYLWLASNLGLDKIVGSTPVTLGDSSAKFHLKRILWWISENTINSLGSTNFEGAAAYWPPTFEEVYTVLTTFYFSLLTGALTLSLTVFLLGRFGYRLVAGIGRLGRRPRPSTPTVEAAPSRETSAGYPDLEPPLHHSPDGEPAPWREWSAVWLCAVCGWFGAAFLHPGIMNHGIAHSAAFPTVVLVVGLAWGVLSRRSPAVGIAVSTGIVAEFLAMFWSHVWLLNFRPEVLEELPGNESYKESANIYFLNDMLGYGALAFVAALAVMQAVLIGQLLRYWRKLDPV